MNKDRNYLFEIGWEVCNKVGGINTVIKSKAPHMVRHYRDNYCLIGPYFPEKTVTEFQEKIPPDRLHHIFDDLHKIGIVCHYGKWLIEGEPNTILVDYMGYIDKNNEIKARLWERYGIDSLGTYFHDFDEPVLWGYTVGKLLEEISKSSKNKKIVAHFHEWLSCGALLYLDMKNVRMGKVFTTHATVLGRTLAGNNVDLYNIIDEINPDEDAVNWHIQAKYQIEKVSAQACEVFTTVSEITAIETEHFLGKKPDVVLYNGLDMKKHPTLEEAAIKHKLYKERVKNFLHYYFFPYYSFDLENTLIFFISGRYEFHNKGIDVFIKALSKLNERLKIEKSKKTIVVFFWVPADATRIKPELSKVRAYYYDIKESIDDNIEDIKRGIIRGLISQRPISESSLFKREFLYQTKKKVLRFLMKGTPPLCTHDLQNEGNDPIIGNFKGNNLLNRKEDRVKVIFYPTYLSGADNLMDLNYDESVLGSHLGVFPSYYEPWGYTPLETAALSVASVTTDFSGFGRYITKSPEWENFGIFITKMFGKGMDEKVDNLFKTIYKFSTFTREERIRNKVEAQRLATLVDWKVLIRNYINAHKLAIERAYK
jgi:glycogen(starch) synthase